jgi:hypothetical protein
MSHGQDSCGYVEGNFRRHGYFEGIMATQIPGSNALYLFCIVLVKNAAAESKY